ncbi:hypothetical protein [Chloroflexus sp.]|uniref:hypothetical protein n=1 Tax=Chloroflexus sp. TaxID=1904827 RepID=UPI00257DB5BB|nr:hypothetical protein [Chloroflexus sp.]
MVSRRRPGAPADFEEIQPNLFLIHNPALGPVLRGEGEREGFHFRLTSWRREGLLARLAQRSFVTLTIADRIAALPAPPSVVPGRLRTIPVQEKQQFSILDLAAPHGWRTIQPAADNTVALPEGQIVRRRRGRGPADYVRVTATGWQTVPDDEALLTAYALLMPKPRLTLSPIDSGWLLPELPLPAPYRRVLHQIAQPHPDGWLLVDTYACELAELLLRKLGLTVVR